MDNISRGTTPDEGGAPHPLLKELWELVSSHPEDSELLEFFRSRIHVYDGTNEGRRRIDPAELI
jgi:hypothetical protein